MFASKRFVVQLVFLFLFTFNIVLSAEVYEIFPGAGMYHACEDSYLMTCVQDPDLMIQNNYQGLVGYISVWVLTSSESTRVCFDLSSVPDDIVESATLHLDAEVQTGMGMNDSGPILIKRLVEPSCNPVCGEYMVDCSTCSGTLYTGGTLLDGSNRTYDLSTAIPDIQAAIDMNASCFCLCLQFGASENYEFGIRNMRIILDMGPPSTPTPAPPTFTPTPTSTPIPTNTPISTHTPVPTATPIPPTATPTVTPEPTPEPTVEPTPTPDTSATPTPFPTSTPTGHPPTSTPEPTPEPTAEPTPEPTAGLSPGVRIWMPSSHYRPGDVCSVDVYIDNPLPQTLRTVPLFVILDVFGSLFFAPGFGDFDYFLLDIPQGTRRQKILPVFSWPDGVGSADNMIWYAALTDSAFTRIIGEMDSFVFSWSE